MGPGATLRRTTDVVENLRVPMESLPHRSGQEVSRALGENRGPHRRRSQRRSGPRESGTEHAAVLCSGPCDAKRDRGGADREEREARRRCCGMETDSWRVCLNRAGKRSRHVVQIGRSNKGTGGMESSVVLFKPCIHLFACTHPSVSISLDRNDWLAYKHQSIARVQTRLDCGSLLLQTSFPPCVSNMSRLWTLVRASASVSSSVFEHVWITVLCLSATITLQPFDQTRLDCGSLFTNPCLKHVWNVDPCLRTRISFQHCVSNTYGLGFRVWVQASA